MFQTNEMIIIGFLGETGVGKSHIIHRYLTNSFPDKGTSTIAAEFSTGFHKMEDGTKLKLKIWDTSGQQKYKQIVCYHLKEVRGLILVYDISNEKSFKKIDEWIQKTQKQQIQFDLIVLIGNKSDLQQSRKIKRKVGEKKAQQLGAQFYQLSSFNYEQVTQIMGQIIEMLIEKKAEKEIKEKSKEIMKNQQKLPLGIEENGAADALCSSNCQVF